MHPCCTYCCGCVLCSSVCHFDLYMGGGLKNKVTASVRLHHVTFRPAGKKVKQVCSVIRWMHVKCLALVKIYHLSMKAQIRMKTSADMVQCYQLWQDRCWQPAATGTYRHVLHERMSCTHQYQKGHAHEVGQLCLRHCPWQTELQKNVCRLGVKEPCVTKPVVLDFLHAFDTCQSWRADSAVLCYRLWNIC